MAIKRYRAYLTQPVTASLLDSGILPNSKLGVMMHCFGESGIVETVLKTYTVEVTTCDATGKRSTGKKEVYQSGPREGESKFWSRFGSLIPGFKPGADLVRIWNGVDFQEIK